jgi:hypothetical protein
VAQFLSNPAVGDVLVNQFCQTMHDIAGREQISQMGELNGIGNLLQWRGASALGAPGKGVHGSAVVIFSSRTRCRQTGMSACASWKRKS